ncbi:MAG: 2-phospho-L-lactate guanylyltransferase [SAR202 cluster bacterium Casp-Chloro-G4]|nr:2-phospho-L-lactate guanylyltransferase [Chloroflexota bacterium]MDA1227113.1 2-phospho-L-lactate guanylyltransferase [Chloroflexota bacterium]PKB61503.1 MAG: 2-phospho-L-lactate guanylyltransferase [SAR202 cluster bacterium Casp-Chloro-G4]
MNISSISGDLHVTVLIPMKPLHLAKSRLSKELDSGSRAALAMGMFSHVVKVAMESAVTGIWVIGGDDQVRERARQLGAQWHEDLGTGLNDAVSNAMNAADEVDLPSLYLPADLPFLQSSDIVALLTASEAGTKLALAPAQRDAGTNAMFVPASSGFRPALGKDSFRRHQDLAQALGLPYSVCESPGFSLDLDTPADLNRCEEIEPGFLGKLTGWSDLSASLTREYPLGLQGND